MIENAMGVLVPPHTHSSCINQDQWCPLQSPVGWCFFVPMCDHHQSEANMRTQQHQPALAPQQILWRGLTKGSTSRCLRKQKAHKLKLGPEQLQKINLLQIYFTVSPGQKINMCSKQLQKFNMATFEKQQKSLEIVRTSKVFERLTHQRRESVQPQQTDKHKRWKHWNVQFRDNSQRH